MALFTFHPNIWEFHFQPIRSHTVSTWLMVIMEVFHSSSRRSISPLENFKQVASINGEHSYIYISIVILSVVDHNAGFKLNNPFMTHCQARNTILSWLPIVTIFRKLLIDE